MKPLVFVVVLALVVISSAASAQEADVDGQATTVESETPESEPADTETDGEASGAAWKLLDTWLDTLEPTGSSFVVVSPRPKPRPDIEAHIRTALADRGASLVIDDAPLAVTIETPDAAVLKQAANLPVKQVVIVRFFGEPSTLVANAYRKDGSPVGNVAIPVSELPSPPEQSDAPPFTIAEGGTVDEPSDDASNDVAGSPADGAEAEQTARAGADELAAYESRKVSLVTFDGSTLVVEDGDSGNTYEGDAALAFLGEESRVENFRSTMSLKRGLYWTAGGLGVAGLATLLVGFFTLAPSYQGGGEVPALSTGLVIGGFGGMFAGIISAVVGWNIDAVDATRREVRGWVKEKNAPLREELGVPEHLSLKLAPAQDGGALVLSWRF